LKPFPAPNHRLIYYDYDVRKMFNPVQRISLQVSNYL
jgi:hypothetical protein